MERLIVTEWRQRLRRSEKSSDYPELAPSLANKCWPNTDFILRDFNPRVTFQNVHSWIVDMIHFLAVVWLLQLVSWKAAFRDEEVEEWDRNKTDLAIPDNCIEFVKWVYIILYYSLLSFFRYVYIMKCLKMPKQNVRDLERRYWFCLCAFKGMRH